MIMLEKGSGEQAKKPKTICGRCLAGWRVMLPDKADPYIMPLIVRRNRKP
jgi:hypothetical protein